MEWKKPNEDSRIPSNSAEEADFEEPRFNAWGSHRPRSFGFGMLAGKGPIIGVGAGVLAFLVILLMLIPGEGTSDKPMAALEARLGVIEQRLADLEKLRDDLTQAVEQGKKLDAYNQRLDRMESTLAQRMLQLSESSSEAQKKTASRPVSSSPPAKPASTKTKPARYYEVRQGDTLYSIGRAHGLSVEELRQLNRLPSGDVIQPGQKLLVSPAS